VSTPKDPPTATAVDPTTIDKPPVPRSRMSWLVKIYIVLAGGALALYLAAGMFGWDRRTSVRDRAPGSVRNSPGGYYFWHAGYHGGK
jgi:hypothetical protein